MVPDGVAGGGEREKSDHGRKSERATCEHGRVRVEDG
jgi:hypothetical protein